MINNRFYLFLFLLGLTISFSCKDKKSGDDEPPQEEKTNFVFVSSGDALSAGISKVDVNLTRQSNTKLSNVELSPPVMIDPITKDGLKRIVNVNALAEGQMVSDICFWSQYAFVSYFTPGGKYRGTVDVYSLKSVSGISRIGRFNFFENDQHQGTNIYAVSYVVGRLFLMCSSESRPAFIEEIVYNPELTFDPVFSQYKDMPDVSESQLKDIIATSEKVYMLAERGVYIYSYLSGVLELDKMVELQNPISMTAMTGNNDIFVLQDNSVVRITSSGTKGNEISLSTAAQQHNRGIAARNKIFVHSGHEMLIIDDNYASKQHFAWTEANTGTQPSFVNHKNVSQMKDWLVIMGNSGNGIRLCGLRDNPKADVTEIYDLNDTGQSLSFLASNDSLLFVPAQDGSMQILWRHSLGMPDVPVYEEDVKEWETEVTGKFKGNTNNKTNYPELFVNDPNATDPVINITIKETTQLYISVVHYDANMAHTLGYYIFDDAISTASGLEKIPIFPNVKSSINVGNTVALCDSEGNTATFTAGQKLGFFLIPNGWSSSANNGYGGINFSGSTRYTYLQYNSNSTQYHVLYRVNGSNPLFMGFEDSTDNDFEDLIISISDNMDNQSVSKINVDGIVELKP